MRAHAHVQARLLLPLACDACWSALALAPSLRPFPQRLPRRTCPAPRPFEGATVFRSLQMSLHFFECPFTSSNARPSLRAPSTPPLYTSCLLYTSDAADDTPCVDL
eukprot:3713116-Pleurochrysis_carterae.AAC.1